MRDINALLNQINKIDNQIEAGRTYIEQCKSNLNEESQKIQKHFDEMKNKADSCISEIKPILSNVCYLYSNILSLNDGRLYMYQQLITSEKFDSNNCLDILDKNINNLKTLLSSIILNKGNGNESYKLLCCSFNTICEIRNKCSQLSTEAIAVVKNQNENNARNADKELNKLKAQKQKLLSELKQDVNNLILPESLFLDNLQLVQEYYTAIRIPLAYSQIEENKRYAIYDISGKVSSVYEWDLNQEGVLHISADAESFNSTKFIDFIKNVLFRCLYAYPTSFKRILLCDSVSDQRIISFAGELSDSVSVLFFNNKKTVMMENSEADIAASMTEINDLISRRLALLGKSKCEKILSYNLNNHDNVQPIVFVLLHGYPHGYSQSADSLASALKNGKEAGVYFIVTSNSSLQTTNDWSGRRIPDINTVTDKNCIFRISNNTGLLTDGIIDYNTKMVGVGFDTSLLLDGLKTAIKEDNKSIDIYSIIPKENFITSPRREKYSKVLSLPIGKDGAKTISLDLDSESDAHVIICGTTGSGKSSLINTIVLSAATLYSPEELEINLISMVKSEFDVYGINKLPHLKTLITKDNIIGAIDVLNYLQDLMQSRMNIVGSDIAAYNASVSKEKRVPRSIIIIDEYQRLIVDDRARTQMTTIAELSRSCGMCLILSSQIVPVEFRSALSLFRHLFEFKSSNAGELISEASNRKSELEGLPGLCFYARGSYMTLARIAYPGKDKILADKVAKIAQSFPNNEMTLHSEINNVNIHDNDEIPFISSKTLHEYREDGVCKIRLGKKYLSNSPLEYPLSYKNSLLCICGEYLLTKNIEAAIIKDILYLSRGVKFPTLYYIDMNKNPNWARKKTVIREQQENWVRNSGGRFVYYGADMFEDVIKELEELVSEREEKGFDNNYDISPVVVMISCAEQIGRESDDLLYVMKRGKNNNVFFVLQFNEFSRNVNELCREINVMEDAILLPDRHYDGEPYASSGLISFLEQTEAADTTAKDMLRTLVTTPLNPNLNILCNNNEVTCFIPYEYADEFFKKLVNKER